MKNIFKKSLIIVSSILFIITSIGSTNAALNYGLKNITATSTKTVEIELTKKVNKVFTQSDLEIYKSIDNTSTKVETEENKVILKLTNSIEKNTGYSLISVSSVEGNIIFKTGDDILLREIQNSDLNSTNQGIKSIMIKDPKTLVLTFTQNIINDDLEFEILKTLEIEKIRSTANLKKIKAVLKGEMLSNEQYLGTITYLETSNLDKIEITKGISYFDTAELIKYEGPTEEEIALENIQDDESSLEDSLLKELEKTENIVNNNDKLELKDGLKSAEEEPVIEKTQLEKLALSQKETPNTGAETWIILLATFIINTFYYYSRRKKV